MVDFETKRIGFFHYGGMGTPTTFEIVFRAYFGYVYRLARVFGTPERDAEDVAQEVFYAFHRALEQSTLKSPNPAPWLRQTTYWITRDQRVGRGREIPTLDEAGDQLVDERLYAAPERSAEIREVWRLLYGLLDSLEFERRAVFVLHELEGMTLAEIAADLHIPPNTAGSRLRQAREDFEAAVERHRARLKHRGLSLLPLPVDAFMHSHRATPVPSGAEDRVWSRVEQAIQVQAPRPRAVKPKRGTMPITALAFGAGLVAGTLAHGSSAPPPPPPPPEAPVPMLASAPASQYVAAAAPAALSAAVVSARTPSPPATEDPEQKERRCLQVARAPLDAAHADPHETLRRLAQCEQRYPHSRFPEARDRIRHQAEELLGESPRGPG